MAVSGGRDQAAAECYVQHGRALHRAAARDQVEVGLLGPRVASSTFRDVQHDRRTGALELIPQRRTPATGKNPRREHVELPRDPIHLEPIGIQRYGDCVDLCCVAGHRELLSWGRVLAALTKGAARTRPPQGAQWLEAKNDAADVPARSAKKPRRRDGCPQPGTWQGHGHVSRAERVRYGRVRSRARVPTFPFPFPSPSVAQRTPVPVPLPVPPSRPSSPPPPQSPPAPPSSAAQTTRQPPLRAGTTRAWATPAKTVSRHLAWA